MDGNRLRTLLVDSREQAHASTRNLLAEIKEWRINLERVSSYEAALEKIKKAPYDICLLNYQSDPNNGLEFLRQATQNGAATPLILLLDSEDDALAREALQAGAIDYWVTDQINPGLLQRSIRYAVQYKQLQETCQKRRQQLQQKLDQYKRIERRLRDQEQQYRMFFNLDVYGIELLDTQGRIIDCNPTYQSLLGYSKKELLGKYTSELATQKGKKLFKRKMAALEKRGYTEGEVALVRKDGTTINLWRRYRATYDEAGAWTGIVVFNRDITERMKAVKQISSLARALEQSPMAVMLTDEAGNVEYVNFRYSELTEYDYEEMVGQNLHTIQSESLSAEEYQEMWEAVTAGNAWEAELRSFKKSGQEYWESMLITPMIDSKDHITHFIIIKDDITQRKRMEAESLQSQQRVGNLMAEHISDLTTANQALEQEIADRKRAEATLRRSRARLKAQYKGIPVPTYTWQKAGQQLILVDYNDAAEADSEGRIADFMGQPASQVFKDRPEVLADFARCVETKKLVRREASYQKVTTGQKRFHVTTYNFVPPNLVIVHIEDITQYKKIEQQLTAYRDKLEALNAQQAADLAQAREALEHEHQEHEQAEAQLKQIAETLKQEHEEHVHSEVALHQIEARVKEIRANIDERLREQYRSIPVPAYSWQVIGGEFILIDFNDAAAEAMGKIVDFLGKPASEIFQDRPQVLEDFDTCYREKRTVVRQAPYQLITTGEHRFFKTSYDFTPPNLIIVHIEDITEYKQMETELNEYRSQVETLTDKHKAELAKRNQAVRREIHKRKQTEQILQQLKARLDKQESRLENVVQELDAQHHAELVQLKAELKTETTQRQQTQQALKTLEKQLKKHRSKQEQLVNRRTAELTRINEQLQREIVEHQRAEDSLREARTRLKAQYKGIPVPTYSWQRMGDDFILIDYNNAAEKASQGTIADLMGKSAGEVFKDRPQVIKDFERCYREKKPVKREAPYKLIRTGETRYFITTYNFVPPNLIICYIEDVSEYKRTEEALQESETQIELLCRLSPEARLTFVNNVYCWYFNRGRADLMGRKLPFVHKDDLPHVEQHLAALQPEKPVDVTEFRVIKPNGRQRWQQWITQAIFDNKGDLLEIRCVGRDITNRKQKSK